LLRHWRLARRLSQLALATEAEISGRHVCFLETGRAQPSREMVQLLASVLGVSLSDRNAMLLAAGYAPAYVERSLGAPEVAHVKRAFEFILQRQEPYPAIVVDGGWNIVMANEAARRIFSLFLGSGTLDPRQARNALHMVCHPEGLRRFIVNWEEFAGPLIQTVHREAAGGLNPAAARLRDELLAHPGMPARWKVPEPRGPAAPVLTMQLRREDLSLAFFSTLTMLATPRDVMLEQLRIECFYPADPATEETTRRLAAAAATSGTPSAGGRSV
jgi:transcriptional regulator with XRE-family HTH domain